jgi:PAS domain S-box-containing protein
MAILKILSGERSGQTVDLRGDVVVVGRHPGCDIRVPDETVSRRHARIISQRGGYYVEDLGSRNGTFLNGQPITSMTRLSHLDRINIFNTTVEFRDEGRNGARDNSGEMTVTLEAPRRTQHPGLYETTAEIDLTAAAVPHRDSRSDVKLQAVLEITRYLRSALESDEALSRIVECVTHMFPHFSRSYLLRHDASTDQLVPVVNKQPDDEEARQATLRPINQALARQVLTEGKAILSVGVPEDRADLSVLDSPTLSFMCAPLVGPTLRTAGILYIESLDGRRRFTHDDLEVFACVAILAGQAIEQATLFGARYRAVVDNAMEGIITISDRGVIESVNPAVAKLFGYGQKELLGQNVSLLMTDDDRQRYAPHIVEYLRSGRGRIIGAGREVEARRKDGNTFPIYLSIGHFELGGRHYYTGIVHDISERHRAEAELRRVNETLEQQVRERTEYIRLLQDVAVIANESESVEEAFRIVLQRLMRFRNWEVAHVVFRSRTSPEAFVDAGVWTAERNGKYRKLIAAGGRTVFHAGRGLVGRAIASARCEWITNLAGDSISLLGPHAAACGLKTVVACPVLIGNEVVAVVEFFSAVDAPPDETFLEVMRHVGTPLGRVIERDRFQRQLVDAVWSQHRRFGQELHDTLGQALTGIGMLADSVARKLAARNEPEADQLAELVAMIQQAKTEVRQLSKGLYPVDVDAQGLSAALEELVLATQQRTGIQCAFKGDREIQIRDNEVSTHLFRIAQESVHNAVKHGKPKKIAIALSKPRGRVTLAIRDDGSGIPLDTTARAGGLGMRIMQYRANAIGAELAVEGTAAGGTLVRCTLKREENHAPAVVCGNSRSDR